MLSRSQQRRARAQVRRQQRRRVACALAACARFPGSQRVAFEPGHAVAPAHQQLQLAVGKLGGFTELRVPRGGTAVVVNESRGRGEPRERHVRGCVRGHRPSVDGDVEPVSLQLTRGGETCRAAADHGRPATLVGEGQLGGQAARAPGQRHARPAVAVVVDDRGVVQPVDGQQESRRAVRAQPHGGADDPVPLRAHRRQPQRRPGQGPGTGRAPAHPGPAQGHAADLQQGSAVYRHLLPSLPRDIRVCLHRPRDQGRRDRDSESGHGPHPTAGVGRL